MSDDIRPFASLSSTLLARRGAARPAMRPQAIQLASGEHNPLEDLGWNDMGDDAVVAPATPATPVAEQQAEIARTFAPVSVAPAEFSAHTPAPARRIKAKSAFTLRLDADRHLKLRLFCAVDHRSAQQVVTQALDEFLARNNDRIANVAMQPGSNPSTGDVE